MECKVELLIKDAWNKVWPKEHKIINIGKNWRPKQDHVDYERWNKDKRKY
jgi:hypothetical protein